MLSPQRKEPPGRDCFLAPEDFRKFLDECRGDPELYAFVWLAASTGARKGEILPRKWTEVDMEGAAPHLCVPRTKNRRSKRLALAEEVIRALKKLPSYRREEYVFPADRSNVRFKGTQGYAWDMRKPFQAACERAGIKNLRIHDLRRSSSVRRSSSSRKKSVTHLLAQGIRRGKTKARK